MQGLTTVSPHLMSSIGSWKLKILKRNDMLRNQFSHGLIDINKFLWHISDHKTSPNF